MTNYLITACGGGSPIQVNDGGNSLSIGQYYYFTFIGSAVDGCYEVTGPTGPSTTDTIDLSFGSFVDCNECQNANFVFRDCVTGNPIYITIPSALDSLGSPTPSFSYNIALIDPLSGTGCYTYINDINTTETGVSIPPQGSGEWPNCLSCIQGSGGNFEFVSCLDDQVFVEIDAQSILDIPQLNKTYFLDTEEGTNGCFTFLGGYTGGTPSQETLNKSVGPFGLCEECCENCLPISANPEYNVCVICCPCGTGTTVNEITVPHPVFTGLYGNSVTQMNSVQLGGQNGLYM